MYFLILILAAIAVIVFGGKIIKHIGPFLMLGIVLLFLIFWFGNPNSLGHTAGKVAARGLHIVRDSAGGFAEEIQKSLGINQ